MPKSIVCSNIMKRKREESFRLAFAASVPYSQIQGENAWFEGMS